MNERIIIIIFIIGVFMKEVVNKLKQSFQLKCSYQPERNVLVYPIKWIFKTTDLIYCRDVKSGKWPFHWLVNCIKYVFVKLKKLKSKKCYFHFVYLVNIWNLGKFKTFRNKRLAALFHSRQTNDQATSPVTIKSTEIWAN